MDRDSKLIFENYKKFLEQFAGEPLVSDKPNPEQTDAMYFLLQVLDPTGALSYPDLYRAAKKVASNEKGTLVLEDMAVLIIAIFCALPNLGTLGAGVGGVGWAGLKATAKAAVKAGPHAAIPLASKMLKFVKSVPGGETLMEKMLKKLLEDGALSKNAYSDIAAVLRKGEVSDFKHAENIIAGRGGEAGIGAVGVGKAATAGAISNLKPGLASTTGRSVFNTAQGDVNIDIFGNENKGPTKSKAELLDKLRKLRQK